ncbi:alpha/beta hydrolase [Thalassobacillus sp. C254]|uniref:alpha/beta hydrolase n=1 Tax=Thalassobacillus sp. C254 TaxID=1225341 RepID=UPI0006D0EE28|nr:alpha/beta hydrolase [Thalassobacillus sp. C254]
MEKIIHPEATSVVKDYRKVRTILASVCYANIVSIILGVFYLVVAQTQSIWNIYGLFFLVTLLANLAISLLYNKRRLLDYVYLLFTCFVMLLVPILNTAASFTVTHPDSRSITANMLMLSLFFAGGGMAWIKKQSYHNPFTLFSREEESQPVTALNKSITIMLAVLLSIGCYWSYLILRGESGGVIEMLLPQYSLFLLFIVLAITALLIIIHHQRMVLQMIFGAAGTALALTFLAPLGGALWAIPQTYSSYESAFGTTVETQVAEDEASFFADIPFSIPEYFFGRSTDNFVVEEDILYYKGTEGVDEGLELYYDVYKPKSTENTPGNLSTVIRIHGGGWTIGDKGTSNNAQVNKYLASQGYVVFDVQYGLSNEDQFIDFADVPAHKVGNFSIDDMVRHLGIFTDYLTDNHEQYGARLDSAFISGPSAGGQLASALGLVLANGDYSAEFGSELQIQGLIPMYPGNGLSPDAGIGGTAELINPAHMVTGESPPLLLFQGTHDSIVPEEVAQDFKEAYLEQSNEQAALIRMPFAGHANDMYFSGYYNQIFMYHMERFLYEHR